MDEASESTGPEEKPTKKPATSAVVAQRVEEILRIRLDGAQFHDCVQYGAEKGWGLSERMIGKYIEKADKLLAERLDRKRSTVIARHIAKREALFARAVNAGDLRTALATLDSEAKLRGLYPDREMKELLALAREQGKRLLELEQQAHDAAFLPPKTGEAGEANGGDPGQPAS
jgi:hypothetical protein